MKALKKIGFALFAICMAFTAMSCKDDDDDSPAVVTEWIAAEDDTPTRIVCYEDNSFAVSASEYTLVVGTYEGDTTKSDATIKINVTKVAEGMLGKDSTKLVTYETTGTGTISEDGKTMVVIIKINDTDSPFGTFTKK